MITVPTSRRVLEGVSPDGRLWLVQEGQEHICTDWNPSPIRKLGPPVVFVEATSPCQGAECAPGYGHFNCSDCVDGLPLIELRVPHCNCRPGLDGTGWYHERDCAGSVSAGVWRAVPDRGPLRIVGHHDPIELEAVVVDELDDTVEVVRGNEPPNFGLNGDYIDLSAWIPSGGSAADLVGCWALELERWGVR